jgi:uncharacterized OB-fold protein
MTVARFWREQKNRYNLIGTKCGSCGRAFFPPRDICIDCHRKSIGKMENLKLSGNGKIISYSIIHEGSDNFKIQIPYAVAIIELDEGTRITGQIVNANCTGLSKDKELEQDGNTQGSPTCTRMKSIEIGSRVTSVFRKISEDGKSGIIHYGYKFKIVD